ncbi:GNAT family N-acetyltransferase [Mongoliimonas terrestris]|uniref:GNAT family N-acetyltransferase n=1 Tax=Mongoliimonas terrestris TaxID=1709001 RepID=UPI000949518B|nr:GNAT family N-acetyltransferase [Mongoliimonas terrestris]
MIVLRQGRLVPFGEQHLADFIAMAADPLVMADHGGALDAVAATAKFEGYVAAQAATGFSRMALEGLDGAFLGAVGVTVLPPDHPTGAHMDVGWRLTQAAWGRGLATEAGAAVLRDAFARSDVDMIAAYTAPDNARSQAVMARLGLRRDPARDFRTLFPTGPFEGLVWIADRAAFGA